jgi:RNA polymerase-interacting CarD/CdnL/TRCF family regulator
MSESTQPHYLTFIRKEARLRTDQITALTDLARRLNRAKDSGGERITDNTLIRVAVDVLIERIDDLEGSSESELRRSVGLPDDDTNVFHFYE